MGERESTSDAQAFTKLLSLPEGRLAELDIARTNLLCAAGLPGAEEMDVARYLRRLEALTNFVRRETESDLARYRREPSRYALFAGRSENFFRIASLVTLLKQECGLRYNPGRAVDTEDRCFLGFPDSKDLLINGLLSDERRGTCNSIPVLIVAIGRRLGYPLHLSANHYHVWARWETEDGSERFNIEASCSGGFNDPPDEHYRTFPKPMSGVDALSGYYLRNFTPADELALFLFSRGWVLEDNLRFEEGLPAWTRCCFLAPTEPMYSRRAHTVVHEALFVRKHGRVMPRGGPDRRPLDAGQEYDPRDLLPPPLAAMALSIKGHYHEVRGETGNATLAYREACRLDPANPAYPADLERFEKWFAGQVAASQARLSAALKSNPLPPPKTTSAIARTPAGVKSPSKAPPPSLPQLSGLGMMHEVRGLDHERAGRWADAQAEYVRGLSFSNQLNEPDPCRLYLHRAIRKEVLAGAAPKPFPNTNDDEDPRQRLPSSLQAVIWAERGRVFFAEQRNHEAEWAFAQASHLAPGNAEYAFLGHQAACKRPAPRLPSPRPATLQQVYTMLVSGPSAMFWLPGFQRTTETASELNTKREG